MISLSDLRQQLNLPPEEDDEVVRMKALVIAQFEGATGLAWDVYTARVEEYEPQHERMKNLRLRTRNSTVTLVEKEDHDGSFTSYDASDWRMRRDSLFLVNTCWPDFVRVTADGGYSSAPSDIQQALFVQARFLKERLQEGNIAVQSQNFEGGAGVFMKAHFHPHFEATVKRYRLPG